MHLREMDYHDAWWAVLRRSLVLSGVSVSGVQLIIMMRGERYYVAVVSWEELALAAVNCLYLPRES
jgi:hypothetical protein